MAMGRGPVLHSGRGMMTGVSRLVSTCKASGNVRMDGHYMVDHLRISQIHLKNEKSIVKHGMKRDK